MKLRFREPVEFSRRGSVIAAYARGDEVELATLMRTIGADGVVEQPDYEIKPREPTRTKNGRRKAAGG